MSLPSLSAICRPSLLQPISTDLFPAFCCRHQSTFRRTRKALRVKPDASFLPSKTATSDHIIVNPPSSAPNVYHTPLKFLPADDPRREMHTLLEKRKSLLKTATAQAAATAASLKPVRPIYKKKYHIQAQQIEEIRKLRSEDPKYWTRVRLAAKFECSQFFVGLCCNSPEMAQRQEEQMEAIRARWGRTKTEAREDRRERKTLWGKA